MGENPCLELIYPIGAIIIEHAAPSLVSKIFLTMFIISSLPIDKNVQKQECSQEVVKEVIGKLRNSNVCRTEAVCNTTKYSASWQEFDMTDTSFNTLMITYEDYEVEHHDTSIKYGLQSLVSEIGGLLGLTLGASILSMFDSVKPIGQKLLLSFKQRVQQ